MNTYIDSSVTLSGKDTGNGFEKHFEIPNIFEVNREFNVVRRNINGNSSLDFLRFNGTKINEPTEVEYIEVVLKGNIKNIYRNSISLKLNIGDYVVVETDTCCDVGIVTNISEKVSAKVSKCNCSNTKILEVMRIPNETELEEFFLKKNDESDAVNKTKEFVKLYNFDMKVTEAHWQFDRQRLTLFFTAPARIDFRELVKDLARTFKTRIELRQISAREEAKRLGDFVGPCGRDACCTTFLHSFNHVTLDHARTQQLSNNVSKLSGNCGRLKCCIKFEYDNYSIAFEKYPPLYSLIETETGIAKIIKVDIFKDIITINYDGNNKYDSISLEKLNEYANEGKVFQPQITKSYNNNHNHNNNHHHIDESLKVLEG